MKEKVLNYFRTDRSFASGLALYQSLPGANRATAATLSRLGNSAQNIQHLHYDLAKLAGISQHELTALINQPIQKPAPVAPAAPAQTEDQGSEFSLAEMSYQEMRSKVAELGLQVSDQKKLTLTAALETYLAEKKS